MPVNKRHKPIAMKNKDSIIKKIRKDTSEVTDYRRQIAASAVVGLIDFSLISLFQLGYIKKLPDLPGKFFDTKKVNTSKDAVMLGLPDGVVSLAAYTATILLATAAIRYKKQSRILDVALAGVVLGQAAGAANYLVNMTVVQKRVCIYCLAGAAINFSALKPLYKIFTRRD